MLNEFIDLLARLVAEGYLTEQEAEELLDLFLERDQLPPGWQLPLTLLDAIPGDLRERVIEALLYYADNGVNAESVDAAQEAFMARMEMLAESLESGARTLVAWQRELRDQLIDYLSQQAQMGAQRAIVAADEDEVVTLIQIQVAYLSRFADTIATGRLSPGQIRERAKLYAGEGRALYYRERGKTNAQWGWIEDYIAVDDRATCQPCAQAEARGPYLPDDPRKPLPGRICLGKGYCRCRLELRYDPAAYLRLTGQTQGVSPNGQAQPAARP